MTSSRNTVGLRVYIRSDLLETLTGLSGNSLSSLVNASIEVALENPKAIKATAENHGFARSAKDASNQCLTTRN